MKEIPQAVIEQRIQDFSNRSDVRQLGILLVSGLVDPFKYVETVTELALTAGIDAPIRMN